MMEDNSTNNELMAVLLTIKADVASTKAGVEALAGPYGRVTMLERHNASQERREWVKVAVLGPLMILGHAFARKMGIDL